MSVGVCLWHHVSSEYCLASVWNLIWKVYISGLIEDFVENGKSLYHGIRSAHLSLLQELNGNGFRFFLINLKGCVIQCKVFCVSTALSASCLSLQVFVPSATLFIPQASLLLCLVGLLAYDLMKYHTHICVPMIYATQCWLPLDNIVTISLLADFVTALWRLPLTAQERYSSWCRWLAYFKFICVAFPFLKLSKNKCGMEQQRVY